MMHNHSLTIDVLILILFFLLNVVVGFRYRGKSKSFKEYAIGNRNFSTVTLTATIVATWVSGSSLFLALEETYSRGLYFIIAMIVGGATGQLLTGRVVAPRVGKFLNNVSVPESLGGGIWQNCASYCWSQFHIHVNRLYSRAVPNHR